MNFNWCKRKASVMESRCVIRDIEPSTASIQPNAYHINMSLFVMDAIRLLQDHPKYSNGLYLQDIVDLLAKEPIACGDLEAQVQIALNNLIEVGFVRNTTNGYRTLGPFARLATARTPRQLNIQWDRIAELQSVNNISLCNCKSAGSLKRKRIN